MPKLSVASVEVPRTILECYSFAVRCYNPADEFGHITGRGQIKRFSATALSFSLLVYRIHMYISSHKCTYKLMYVKSERGFSVRIQ